MSKVIKLVQRLIVVVTICACLSYFVVSASRRPDKQPSSESTSFSSYPNQPVTITGSLAEILFALSPSHTKGEPLLLLLSGIAMFIAATTAKRASDRKRSSLR